MGKAKHRPFAGIDDVELGMDRTPNLQPNNVRRDLSAEEGKQIVSNDEASYLVEVTGYEYVTFRAGSGTKLSFRVIDGNGPSQGDCATVVWEDSDYFQRDNARIVCSAFNVSPKEVTESDYERLVSKEQPMVGRFLLVNVLWIRTKKENRDFLRHTFAPVDVVKGPDGAVISASKPEVNNARDIKE